LFLPFFFSPWFFFSPFFLLRSSSYWMGVALCSFFWYDLPAYEVAAAHKEHGPVYFYTFAHRSPRHGAGHGLELPFLFGRLDREEPDREFYLKHLVGRSLEYPSVWASF